jgi:hypothetical protein
MVAIAVASQQNKTNESVCRSVSSQTPNVSLGTRSSIPTAAETVTREPELVLAAAQEEAYHFRLYSGMYKARYSAGTLSYTCTFYMYTACGTETSVVCIGDAVRWRIRLTIGKFS